MTKHSRTVRPSRWDLYRARHNIIRARNNGAPIQRIVRSVTSITIKLWVSGEYANSVVESTLSRSNMAIPHGLPPAHLAPGCALHFYDAQHATVANAHLLRILTSSIIKRELVVMSVGNYINCCPAIYCQLGHKEGLGVPIPPVVCDQCMKHGVSVTACEYCTAPRFLHM